MCQSLSVSSTPRSSLPLTDYDQHLRVPRVHVASLVDPVIHAPALLRLIVANLDGFVFGGFFLLFLSPLLILPQS
jgi:hypothetical protein